MRLYNSFTNKIEAFMALKEGEISLYVCGITPYDTTHLGHAFVYIQFDALVRWLRYKGYKVNYVQNVTDIDDDILKKAKEEGRDWKGLGEFWTKRFTEDCKTLNILPPDHFVKATDSIPRMVQIISKLLLNKHAYRPAENIYFDIQSFPKYGKLSKYSKDEMIKLSRERGADPDDPNKKDPLDFILWQASKQDEPSWEASFGSGRPGWHIECSAMIHQYLGEQIDIHGGGFDLVYPHHESEIAQSESYTGKLPFVKYWLHAGMVKYKGEKMSKSLGNLVMIKDLLKKYSSNTVRYLLLSHHYRKEWEFKEGELIKAQKSLDVSKKTKGNRKKFEEAMENDLNINEALKFAGRKELKILGFTS